MVEYSKNKGIRTVIFTSGIKKSGKIEQNIIDYYVQKMSDDLNSIEDNEPWNNRLKDKIKSHYNSLINPSEFSEISKQELLKLKEIGLDKIVFDFQAYEQETDSILMGRNNQKYNCLLDSLLNASFANIETDIHFIPMKPNYKEIGDILELLEIAKIKNISILKFVPQGRGKLNVSDLVLDNREIYEFMELLNYYKQFYSGNVRVGIPLLGDNTHMCNAGLEKLDIKFDGTILPCPAFKELDLETMKKFGIKYYNIYENLEEVRTPGGKRNEPLCQKVYQKNSLEK